MAAGALMSYGVNRLELYRRAATYVDKIFKGAKPGDLPIQQPTKFYLTVNRRLPKSSGSRFPARSCCAPTR